jgi:hypothetical protein
MVVASDDIDRAMLACRAHYPPIFCLSSVCRQLPDVEYQAELFWVGHSIWAASSLSAAGSSARRGIHEDIETISNRGHAAGSLCRAFGDGAIGWRPGARRA